MQGAVQDPQIGAAQRHVDAIWFHLHAVLHVHHRHRRAFAEQTGQETDMAGMLVRDHHEGHPAVGRHMAEELFHGLQAAGGGADADDQKSRRS